ncbi:hypothetical protein QCM80_29815 [Bradyrhizobium sp. SSUT112]|uniref:hypothetical protein n=1 Tax=Bradyrhizobium sp. SSUT112 TaxID=3040604 RepID=UPI00244A4CEC|nr:hypothetical protein [Bradyrhizobium sp. SSUT112]MDH2354832.1 hypothetical protein [Bradyrhizobium sp. SSUT112]
MVGFVSTLSDAASQTADEVGVTWLHAGYFTGDPEQVDPDIAGLIALARGQADFAQGSRRGSSG